MKLFWVLAVFLLSPTAWSQDDYWTPRPWWLRLPPSVQANGFGEVGVVRVDNQAAFFNPGALGLATMRLGGVSFYPGGVNLGELSFVEFDGTSYLVRMLPNELLTRAPLSLVVASQRVRLRHGPYIERSCGGIPTGRRFYWNHHNHLITLGVGYSRLLDLGLGVSLRYVTESVSDRDWQREDTGVDVGLLVRVPLRDWPKAPGVEDNRWRHLLILGASFTNYGLDMRSGGTRYEMMKTGRFGVGMRSTYGSENKTLLSVFPAYEKEAIFSGRDSGINKFGLEIGMLETLLVRGGIVERPGRRFKPNTFGFTLSTRGLKKLLFSNRLDRTAGISKPGAYLLANLEVELVYALSDLWSYPWAETNFYSIDITL